MQLIKTQTRMSALHFIHFSCVLIILWSIKQSALLSPSGCFAIPLGNASRSACSGRRQPTKTLRQVLRANPSTSALGKPFDKCSGQTLRQVLRANPSTSALGKSYDRLRANPSTSAQGKPFDKCSGQTLRQVLRANPSTSALGKPFDKCSGQTLRQAQAKYSA